jgi:hypothetical protein
LAKPFVRTTTRVAMTALVVTVSVVIYHKQAPMIWKLNFLCLWPGTVLSNRGQPKSCSGRAFNSKLGHIVIRKDLLPQTSLLMSIFCTKIATTIYKPTNNGKLKMPQTQRVLGLLKDWSIWLIKKCFT